MYILFGSYGKQFVKIDKIPNSNKFSLSFSLSFINLVFNKSTEFSEDHDIIWAEDVTHNMLSCKINNLTFKYYTTTTTLCIQGQDEQLVKKKLYSLLAEPDLSGTTSIDLTSQGETHNNIHDDGNIFAAINGSEDPMIEIFTLQDATETGTQDLDLLHEISSLKEDISLIKHMMDVLESKVNMHYFFT